MSASVRGLSCASGTINEMNCARFQRRGIGCEWVSEKRGSGHLPPSLAFFFSAAAAFFLALASLFPCGARWVMEGVVRQNQRARFKQQL